MARAVISQRNLEQEIETYAFRHNRRLKRPGIQFDFTHDQIVELAKCANDPVYFINTYVKIVHVDLGVVPFELFDYQEEFIRMIHENRFVTARMARQMGKSTTVAAYMCHYAIFNPNKTIVILANKSSTAKEILQRVQLAYENLPLWLQQGVVAWNKGSFELENGSRIMHGSTSSSAIRGMSISFAFIDEVAHIPKKMWEAFYDSVYPTVTSGKDTKIVMVSTPLGLNHFYDIHTKAMAGKSEFKYIDVTWEQHPERDEEWKRVTIANTSERKFAQEFECAFEGSSRTLIAPGTLFNIMAADPVTDDGFLKVFEQPRPDRVYFMSVDPSLGVGGDYSAFTIFDISDFPFKEVASYKNKNMPTTIYPDVIFQVASRYNEAYVLVELNNGGHEVANTLWVDLEYENLLFYKDKEDLVGQSTAKRGIWTSSKTKKIGCSRLKELVESKRMLLRSEDTLNQLKFFVLKANDRYAAEDDHHDDLVMCLVNMSFYVTSRLFRNRHWNGDPSKIDLRAEFSVAKDTILDQMSMPPLVVTGHPEEEPVHRLPNFRMNRRQPYHSSGDNLGDMSLAEKKAFLA